MNDNASTHSKAWSLIPWLVNDTIAGDERTWLENHLAACAACREQYVLERQMREGMLADDDAATDDEAQAGLRRLWARIELEDAQPPPASAVTVAQHGWRGRGLTRLLAAAVVVEAIGLGALSVSLIQHGGSAASQPGYRTLSAPALAPTGATVRFVPAPTMTVATLRKALDDAGLYIVESRPDSAIYGLAAVPTAAAGKTAARLREAITRLSARSDVLLVEPIRPLAPPSQ